MSVGKWPSLYDVAKHLGIDPEKFVGSYEEDAKLTLPADWSKEELVFPTHDEFGNDLGYASAVQDAKRKNRGKKATRQ